MFPVQKFVQLQTLELEQELEMYYKKCLKDKEEAEEREEEDL